MIRSILYVLWLYGSLLGLGVIFLPTLFLPKKYAKVGFVLFVKGARWGLKNIAGVTTKIIGIENLPNSPTIVAVKHQSMWDTLCLHVVFEDLRVIMKKELRFYPFFGWYAIKLKQIPIDRHGTVRTIKELNQHANAVTKEGGSILIFPEGTRTAPGADTKYHAAGLASLYKSLDVPITPIATNSGQCWPAKGIRRFPGTIIYEVLPAIPTGLSKKQMMSEVQEVIETKSKALLGLNPDRIES